MKNLRLLALLVILANLIVGVWHLFIVTRILPGPQNSVPRLAIGLMTLGHLCMAAVLWKLANRAAGLVLLLFFLAAICAGLYEHLLHPGPNNIFMVASSDVTGWFDFSVFVLLALEVTGCWLAIRLLGSRPNHRTQPGSATRAVS